MNTKLISLIALVAASAVTPVFAADEHNAAPGLTAAGAPLGLHGVDPVAFIEIGNRVEGSAAFTVVQDGVAYYFATRENMNAFKREPAKYLPQNGGFCTFGVSVAKKFDGDPQYADVYNGKLYVFLNEDIFRMYQKDKAGVIAKAEKNWTKIQHTAAREL
ncbi:MAG: YHS domain-containing (seleno)protein [Parvularculaceae bacterium]